jgi:hypothetical protein
MCLPGHDDGLVPRKIEGTVNVVKARMEHRRIGRDAWRARLEAGWGRDNQQNTTAPSRHKRRFRDGRSPPRAFLLAARVCDCTRMRRRSLRAFAKSGGAPSAALFYRRCSAF